MLGTAIDPKPPAANREHLKVHIPKPQTGPTLEGFMRKIAFKFLTLATIFATAGLIPAQTNDDDSTLKLIAGYRQWTRVNQQPVVVSAGGIDSIAI
jgi:hypothetical protein